MLTYNCITVENGFFFGDKMLYNRNKEAVLSGDLFKSPTAEYRSTPFWAWNADLDRAELARQIDTFAEMGFGGFHMHVRQGLESAYLGDDFLDAIRFCTEYAKSKNMLAWLYDEDRWPSGVAGGMVTKNKKHRQKFLTMSVTDRENCAQNPTEAAETGKPYFVAAFDVSVDSEGRMISYRKIERDEPAKNKRYFFLEQKQGGEMRYNYQDYVDAMSKEAIDEFIAITYEKFKEAVGDEFGKTIPAIFTDEPQVHWNTMLKSGFDKRNAMCPFTTDFAETYEARYGKSLIPNLPELFFTTDLESAKETRYNYYSHVAERFCEAYMDNIGDWCEKNGLALTGHLLGEDTLYEAALDIADVMRAYRRMQMPGVDLLCDDVVFNTPIQCRSIVHQYGREAMLSEMYGVTGWDFDFRGHKYQGDWQALLGVNVRVPHLAWQTMKGEGKRDYPASISYQSSWAKEYKYLEDHYARINTAMSRGTPAVNIAIIYPVDSYNILFSSIAESRALREEMEKRYEDTAKWLLGDAFEFDYISESLLPELCANGTAPLKVGKMSYDAIIVSDCTTLRAHTIKVLDGFKRAGGRLIIMGNTPEYCEGKRSELAGALLDGIKPIPHSREALRRALGDMRRVEIFEGPRVRTDGIMYTERIDGDFRWLLLGNMYKPDLPHLIHRRDITVSVQGTYKPYLYDTLSGEIRELPYKADGHTTEIYHTLYDLDTALIKLEPTAPSSKKTEAHKGECTEIYHPHFAEYTLSEPNVLVLDMAKYSIDGEPYSERDEEILRIDSIVRGRLGLTERRVKFVQPWAIDGSPEDHILSVRYTITSEIDVSDVRLALENADKCKITLNGKPITAAPDGYYIDRYVKTVALGNIPAGESVIEISMPFGLRTDLEACYLIGSFGTAYRGREARILPLPDRLNFGSVVNQGLAFYGANIDYTVDVELDSDGTLEIIATHYRGALIGVAVDGVDVGRIAFQPFALRTPALKKGKHRITYTLFGTRYNTLTALHNLNADKKRMYMGPIYWRSENEAWAYEYQTRPMGILKTPILKFYKEEL